MSELAPSSDVSQNPYRIIFDFWISVKFLIQKNCYNSRTTNDIDIKLGPVTKPDNLNKTAAKNVDDGFLLENCDVIVIFPIYG